MKLRAIQFLRLKFSFFSLVTHFLLQSLLTFSQQHCTPVLFISHCYNKKHFAIVVSVSEIPAFTMLHVGILLNSILLYHLSLEDVIDRIPNVYLRCTCWTMKWLSAVSATDKESAIERYVAYIVSEWNLHGVPNAQIALDVD